MVSQFFKSRDKAANWFEQKLSTLGHKKIILLFQFKIIKLCNYFFLLPAVESIEDLQRNT